MHPPVNTYNDAFSCLLVTYAVVAGRKNCSALCFCMSYFYLGIYLDVVISNMCPQPRVKELRK